MLHNLGKKIRDFIIKAYWSGLKSIAVFPDKKLYGIISMMPFKKLAYKLKNEGVELHPQNFTKEELENKKIILFVNLAPRKMKGIESQGMILAADQSEKGKVVLISPEKDIEVGSKIR